MKLMDKIYYADKKKEWQAVYVIRLLLGAVIVFSVLYKAFAYYKEYRQKTYLKTTAIDYIQEKYGFEAEFQELELGISKCKIVTLSQNEYEFYVYIDNHSGTEIISDTYQKKEVENAILEVIQETYPNYQGAKINVRSAPPEDYVSTPLCLDANTKFNGSNLNEILQDCKIELRVYYAETEFSDCELFHQLQSWNTEGAFVSFDTKAHLKEYLDEETRSGWHLMYTKEDAEYLESDITYAPHIEQIWLIDEENNKSTNYPLRDTGVFFYCCPEKPNTHCTEIPPTALTINYFHDAEKAEQVAEQAVSGAYQFDNGWNSVYIFYPVSKLPELENLTAILYCHTNASNSSNHLPLTVHGEYAVFGCSFPSFEFLLTEKDSVDMT